MKTVRSSYLCVMAKIKKKKKKVNKKSIVKWAFDSFYS